MPNQGNRLFYAFLVSFLMFVGIYSQYQLTPVAEQIMSLYGIDKQLFSTLFTAPMAPAILLSIPAGILVDRFGVRPVVLVAATVTLIGLLMRPFVSSFSMMYAALFLAGVIVAVLNGTIAKVLGQRFPIASVGRVVGIVMAGGSSGMVIGTATTGFFPSIQTAFLFSAVLMVVATVLAVFFFRVPPQPQETQQAPVGIKESLQKVLRSNNIRLSGVCAGLVMALNVSLSGYLPMALQEVRGLSADAAGGVASIYLLGILLGSVIGPQLLQKFHGLRAFAVVIGVLGGVGGAFGWLAPIGPMLLVSLFLTGCAVGSFLPVFISLPILLHDVGPRYAGTGGGVIATLQLLGAVILPTYVLFPLAGGDFQKMFLFAGIGLWLVAVLAQLIRVDG